MEPLALRELLLEHLAAGTLPAKRVLAALEELAPADPDTPPSLQQLLEALDQQQEPGGPALRSLRHEVVAGLINAAQEVFARRTSNRPVPKRLRLALFGFDLEPPPPWPGRAMALRSLKPLLRLMRDRNYLVQQGTELTRIADLAADRYHERLAAARGWDIPWERLGLPAGPDADALTALEQEFEAASGRADQQQILDRALHWQSDAVCPVLSRMCRELWAQDRAAITLSLRFGQPMNQDWHGWQLWLNSWEREIVHDRQALGSADQTYAAELLFLGHVLSADPDKARTKQLEAACREVALATDPGGIARRFKAELAPRERMLLTAAGEPPPLPAEVREPPAEKLAVPATAKKPPPAKKKARKATKKAPRAPAAPAMWQDHLRPFFLENWYFVTGILLLVVGSSLVAYQNWDRHWLVRYTILPVLLGGLTAGLAWLGSWLERKDTQFKDTAAILRGAAIGLLPVNFMTVSFLGDDPAVAAHRLPVVLGVAVLYLGLFGFGLRRWCAAVHPSLGGLLGGTLLLLNGLVTLRPIAEGFGGAQAQSLPLIVGSGFHLGFVVLAGAVLVFTTRVLTKELAASQRLVWFFGATLVVTFLQVFAWVHAAFGRLPQIHTYAPMLILTGGLLLHVERRAQALRQQQLTHGGESFLGFALILLGCLMGQAQEYMRIGCLLLAGSVWLYEASAKRHPAHSWIGVMLLTLGAGSVGLLSWFDKVWLPALGLGLALGLDLFRLAVGGKQAGRAALRRAAAGVRNATLFFTVVIAVLVQWHFRSPPLWTAGYLLAVAAWFAVSANRERQLTWLHTAMVVLAVALPYLGCVDMLGRTLHGNTMVFGLSVLSVLWLLLNWLTPTRLSLRARSTVLWTYGALAVVGMLLRVALEQQALAPGDVVWQRQLMVYIGPLVMTGCLLFATWFSRSLVPALMAAVIVIILFPELKVHYAELLERLGWGSGLGSASTALVLTVACFLLRRWKALKKLSAGDRFLDRTPFPLQRRDHTLFTWPLTASILFLIIKTDTITLARNLANEIGPKTATAILLTAVTWTLLGVYHHKQKFAKALIHIGWIALLLAMVVFNLALAEQPRWHWPLFNTGVTLTALCFGYHFVLAPRLAWARDLLLRPTLVVLEVGSTVVGLLCALLILGGAAAPELTPLVTLLALHCAWHEVSRRTRVHGVLLFLLPLLTLLAWHSPGDATLLQRLDIDNVAWPLLIYALATQALLLLSEPFAAVRAKTRSLLQVLQVGVVALAVVMAGVVVVDFVGNLVLTPAQEITLIAVVLLAARRAGSGSVLLLSFAVGYVAVHGAMLGPDSFPNDRLRTLLSPWHLATLAAAMPVVYGLGLLLYHALPRLVEAPEPLLQRIAPVKVWLLAPASIIACVAALYHTVHPVLRDAPVQLWTPYLAATAVGLSGLLWRRGVLFAIGGVLLTLGNVHAVRVLWGDWLLDNGLSHIHLIGLGLVASLLMVFAARPLLRSSRQAQTGLDHASIGMAGLVLLLLSGNYLVHPDLLGISNTRFLVSGAMAYLAGLAFRQVARHADNRPARDIDFLEGAYHFGVTLALWCAALLIPALRQPNVALLALSVPVYYFAVRAELSFRQGLDIARRYRLSAAAIGFAILALYAARGIFHLVLFPDSPVDTSHYHVNSPSVMVLGLLLLRLHALGGTYWLALYGGLAVMVGSFFALTWFPKLSPFAHVVPAAWCAVALAHFWTIATTQRSPLRAGIQLLAGATDQEWTSLRRAWGWCLLVGTHLAVLVVIFNDATITKGLAVAPLLLGAASVLVHHGVLQRSTGYFVAAGIEVLLALHADFVVHSYLDREHVVWVLLLLWALLLVMHAALQKRLASGRMDTAVAGFTAITVLHVLYHGPTSTTGLWVMALVGVLGALTPLTRDVRSRDYLASGLLLVVPTWLAYFSQFTPTTTKAVALLPIAGIPWPYLTAATAVLLTSGAARLIHGRTLPDSLPDAVAPNQRPRLYNQLLWWLSEAGAQIHLILLGGAMALAVGVQALHYGRAFEVRELVLLCLLHAAFAVTWFVAARRLRDAPGMFGYVCSKLSVLLLFLAIRHHLMLTTSFWQLEYDVWASLLVSFLLVGARQLFGQQPRELRVPFTISMLALPAFSLGWTVANDLGTDVTLMVVGLHSLMFSFLGKDDRESPYHMAAIAGFVAFVMITFWSKLELRTLQAYVIPVGLGVLVLLQMFRARVQPLLRNQIRLATLLAMLGSAAYYALVDPRYPVAFNLTLLILCLLAMGLGGFLRIRMYVVLGFTGVVVNLGSILYRAFSGMERAARMTSVGILVLLLGAGLVAGAIYYKTHRDTVNRRIDDWRRRFGEWE
ncbi:MAG: hypothetical protein ACYTKC_01035 [Planctomycetota bacterium]